MEESSSNRLCILAADDSMDSRQLLRLFLKNYPCELDFVEDGDCAVRQFQKKKYDVILMDMQMPVLDGYAATSQIRAVELAQQLHPVHIVALTANSTEEQVKQCLEAGCSMFLEKPLSYEKLIDILNLIHGRAPLILLSPDMQGIVPGYIQRQLNAVEHALVHLEEERYEQLEYLGHRLKGSGKAYGLSEISLIGHVLEDASGKHDERTVGEYLTKLIRYLRQLHIVYVEDSRNT